MSFSQIAKELREETGLSQQRLGEKLGISSSGIGHLEIGDCEPKSSTLIAYAKYFDVSTDYLLGLVDDFSTPTAAPMGDGLTSEERKLISVYKSLSPDLRETLWNLLATWTPTETLKPLKK